MGVVLRQSWELFKANAGVAIGAMFVVGFILAIPLFAPIFGVQAYFLSDVISTASSGARYGRPPVIVYPSGYFMVQPILGLWAVVLGQIFGPGLTRLNVAIARNESPSIGAVFSGFDRVPASIGWALIVQAPVLLGQMLIAVLALADVSPMVLQPLLSIVSFVALPVLVLQAVGFIFVPWFIADRKLGPIAAAKAAWNATSSNRGETFLLMLALFGINLLGACACGIGMLVTIPWSMIAIAYAYAYLPQGQQATQTY